MNGIITTAKIMSIACCWHLMKSTIPQQKRNRKSL